MLFQACVSESGIISLLVMLTPGCRIPHWVCDRGVKETSLDSIKFFFVCVCEGLVARYPQVMITSGVMPTYGLKPQAQRTSCVDLKPAT